MANRQMKILILGGTGDALSIAQSLITSRYNVSYSIAGIVRQPELNCRVLSGGFRVQQTHKGEKCFANGVEGLQWHLQQQAYDLVLDATHPYALQISEHAAQAAQQSGTTLWRYLRAPWTVKADDNWTEHIRLSDIISKINKYKMPFFTVGREVFSKTDLRKPEQQWLVRSAGIETVNTPNIIELQEIGPFSFEHELALFKTYRVDALVSKNSGGDAVAAKLAVAKQCGVPVFLLQRPTKPPVEQCFSAVDELIQQIKYHFPA